MPKITSINGLIKKMFPIPVALKPQEPGTRRRARALAVLLLISSATVWFWASILAVLYFIFNFDIHVNVYFSSFVSIVLGLQVWSYYHYGNLRLASMLFTLTYFLMALALVLMSGGYHSANLVVLLSCPVVSFCAGGKDEGIMNCIFVGLTGLALVAIDKMGMTMLNLLAGLDEAYLFAMAWVVTLTIIASCMVTYNMEDV